MGEVKPEFQPACPVILDEPADATIPENNQKANDGLVPFPVKIRLIEMHAAVIATCRRITDCRLIDDPSI